jgi:hypothetical protein
VFSGDTERAETAAAGEESQPLERFRDEAGDHQQSTSKSNLANGQSSQTG